jgi:RNA recognition motif-containing protein
MSSTIDNLTDKLAATSVQDPVSVSTDPQDTAVLASAAEGRRLYIGNLAYATTEGELKEFFKDYEV